MTRTKNDIIKPLQKIEISVTEILISNGGSLKPFIQTFQHEPENVALQSLGSILGIFEIEDHTEDSAFIVNFLASIVKKEYFLHPKRAAIESLEATLHKINLALSELIKNDNTAWLGKLNATICVFERNNIHFSVAGKAKTLLIRGGILSDISIGLAEESNVHPLKTFTEVSSGRLKAQDKIILTTPGLFDIFSPDDIQKNANRFSDEKFAQFLNTALVNQLNFGSTLLINITEVPVKATALKKSVPTKTTQQEEIPNVFSQSAFASKKPKTKAAASNAIIAAQEDMTHLHSASQESEYIDSKTGHIYVQGDVAETAPNEKWIQIKWFIEDTLANISCSSKKIFTHTVRFIRGMIIKEAPVGVPNTQTDQSTHPLQYEDEHTYQEVSYINESLEDDAALLSEQPSSHANTPKIAQNPSSSAHFFIHIRFALQKAVGVIAAYLPRSLPRFLHLRAEFKKLNATQKKYAFMAVFAIFVVPFIFVSLQEKPKVAPIPAENAATKPKENALVHDKGMHILTQTQSILANNTLVTTLLLKDELFAITKNSVISLKNPQTPQSFALPETFGTSIIKATAMGDLQTIFLITNSGKIVSFTPSNHNFTPNNIALPDTSTIQSVATYLTYLYILDGKDNTIYRYPRAEGGFGEKTTWLKESVDIQNSDTMAINEDVYITQNDHMLAFNKGRKDPIAFEKSATAITFSQVFTQSNVLSLYVLDTASGRLIQFEKSGAITNQYAHAKLKEATSFVVQENLKKAFLTTPSEVFSVDIQ